MSFGKSLKFNVILASPVCDKKSGITLLIFIINSPSLPGPVNPPCGPISKSPDSMLAVIAVVATTAITASIESGDFDIGPQGGLTGPGNDGEFMMKIRRVIPDFLSQTGDARITLNLRDFPNDTAASSTLGPFTVTSGTQKIDTRARARSISLKIDNTSTGQFWKVGTFRIDYQPDGRR